MFLVKSHKKTGRQNGTDGSVFSSPRRVWTHLCIFHFQLEKKYFSDDKSIRISCRGCPDDLNKLAVCIDACVFLSLCLNFHRGLTKLLLRVPLIEFIA